MAGHRLSAEEVVVVVIAGRHSRGTVISRRREKLTELDTLETVVLVARSRDIVDLPGHRPMTFTAGPQALWWGVALACIGSFLLCQAGPKLRSETAGQG